MPTTSITRAFQYLMIFPFCSLMNFSASAEKDKFLDVISPKLKHFLLEHPERLGILTNTKAFSGKTISIHYFYTDDVAKPCANHEYPDDTELCFIIKEDLNPQDQFLCLLSEALKAETESNYYKIYEKAKLRDISRADFVREMFKLEADPMIRLRDMLPKLKFTKSEIKDSILYKFYKDCPDDLDQIQIYLQKFVAPYRDLIKEKEDMYDSMYDFTHPQLDKPENN